MVIYKARWQCPPRHHTPSPLLPEPLHPAWGGSQSWYPHFAPAGGLEAPKLHLYSFSSSGSKNSPKRGKFAEVYPSIWGFPCSSVSKKICLTSQDGIWRMACILPASELGGKASLAEVPIPFPVCSVSSDWKTLCNERKKKKKKKSACSAGDPGSIPGLGRAPGEGNGNILQYPCLEKSHGQRSLVGCSPWGCTKSWAQLTD